MRPLFRKQAEYNDKAESLMDLIARLKNAHCITENGGNCAGNRQANVEISSTMAVEEQEKQEPTTVGGTFKKYAAKIFDAGAGAIYTYALHWIISELLKAFERNEGKPFPHYVHQFVLGTAITVYLLYVGAGLAPEILEKILDTIYDVHVKWLMHRERMDTLKHRSRR